MYQRLLLLALFSIALWPNSNVYSATCTSTGNGLWSAPGTWSCGAVPGTGDIVVIASGNTVTVNSSQYTAGGAGAPSSITINGTLTTSNALYGLNLPATATVTINTGGSLTGSGFILMGPFSLPNIVWSGLFNGNQNGPKMISQSCPASSGGCSLPITLVSFTGAYHSSSGAAKLTWQVTKETDFSHFEIQKSFDGINFIFLGKIIGNNNSSLLSTYTYSDTTIQISKQTYYRLKEVDINGSYTYSGVIVVVYENNLETTMTISPNPSSQGDDFEIQISNATTSSVLKIFDLNGRLFFSKTFNLNETTTLSSTELGSQLSPGCYIVSITSEESGIVNKRLIIQ
jgi:hypothetical protein